MITEAIILAGGLGTRLRQAVPDLPKCMAPVAGKPFLHHLIKYYQKQGIRRFIFSLGYMHDVIEIFLEREFENAALQYSSCIEKEPLGTGGAVAKAAAMVSSASVLVVNGDTFFSVNGSALSDFFDEEKMDCVLSLKPMTNIERFGVVNIDADRRITSFREKQFYAEGLINGGVYALNVKSFLQEKFPLKFSFEKEYLEKLYRERNFYGFVQDGYFIDIGIPEDLHKANTEFLNLSA